MILCHNLYQLKEWLGAPADDPTDQGANERSHVHTKSRTGKQEKGRNGVRTLLLRTLSRLSSPKKAKGARLLMPLPLA